MTLLPMFLLFDMLKLLCGLSSGWRVIVDGKHTPILFFDQLSVSV
ncbi:hypothetical protein PI125_g8601 [Phytophthora idaei]|nr:hypothetical protein PI125_g8601 [Phytophthora idaei]